MTAPDGLGRELLAHYVDLEVRIAADLAGRLSGGMDRPDWPTRTGAQVGGLRRWVRRLLAGSRRRTSAIIARLLGAAPPAVRAEVERRVVSTHETAARYAVEVYRRATAAGIGLDGRGETGLARRHSVQRALNRALDQGITGFRDARGREWSLASYLEMVAVTAAGEAILAGEVEAMRADGANLAIVRGGPQECEPCRPWIGKVLTLDESGRGGATIGGIRVAGSLSEARAAGWKHPRCRCRLYRHRPGLAVRPRIRFDPEGSAARTRLRALERRARAWRLRAAAALDDTARRRAVDGLRVTQAEIAAHVAASAHLGIRRDQRRERTDLGFRT